MEIVPAQNFEQRMKERIRDSIGELLSDEELSTMLKRSMEELFFKPRTIQTNNYGATKQIPPLMHEIVETLLKDKVKEAAKEFIDAHQTEVNETIKEALGKGAGEAILKAINAIFSNQLNTLQYNIQNMIQNKSY